LNGTIAAPYDLTNGGIKFTKDQLRDACCHLANMTEEIDKAAVCVAGCNFVQLRPIHVEI